MRFAFVFVDWCCHGNQINSRWYQRVTMTTLVISFEFWRVEDQISILPNKKIENHPKISRNKTKTEITDQNFHSIL